MSHSESDFPDSPPADAPIDPLLESPGDANPFELSEQPALDSADAHDAFVISEPSPSGLEPEPLTDLDSSNPFDSSGEPGPGELQPLPTEFETPGVAAAIESATPAFTTPENMMEPEAVEPAATPREPTLATVPASAPAPTMESVRAFSESVGVAEAKASVPASFPFSLLIEGKFGDYERAKFLDVFASEDLGFREIDLEPQLDSGRILIPRISEYAGVLLVQALRSLPVKMRLGPSAEIYRKDASLDENTTRLERPPTVATTRALGPADALDLPITTEETLPQFMSVEVIDTITVSATLKTAVVEAESSPEFSQVIERLQSELRERAHRQGAAGVIRFKTELTALSVASHYRVIATGVAVKPDNPNPYTAEGAVPATFVDPDLVDPLSDPLLGEPGQS